MLFINFNCLIHRRIKAIKLAWFILVVEAWNDFKYGVILNIIKHILLELARKEAERRGLPGVGDTFWWKKYLKIVGK